MSACDIFTSDKDAPWLCATCQFTEIEHNIKSIDAQFGSPAPAQPTTSPRGYAPRYTQFPMIYKGRGLVGKEQDNRVDYCHLYSFHVGLFFAACFVNFQRILI
jgi:hypothetical protein